MILLDRITKTYPGDVEPALDNVSLHIEPHEFVFLVGKSGAGKSTLIKMITKEENPDSGKIIIGGIDLDYVKKRHIPHYRRRLGVVFQDFKLLPTRTVFENVAFALEIAGMKNSEIARTVPKVLDLVGLSDKDHKFPGQLSGGERQRVGIARSVACQPKILIADEPTGNLDPLTRHEIIDLLQKINDFGTTLLVTTHDENIVNNLSKRVITMKDGRIVDDQKNHGIYKLDHSPVKDELLKVVPNIVTPEAGFITKIQVPGEKYLNNLTTKTEPQPEPKPTKPRTEASVKIDHPTRRKPVATATSAKKTTKEKTPNISITKPRATKPPVRGSANEWYTASRPLKAAPRLSDLSLGQTVKLKPAPSMANLSRRPVISKPKQKQVI